MIKIRCLFVCIIAFGYSFTWSQQGEPEHRESDTVSFDAEASGIAAEGELYEEGEAGKYARKSISFIDNFWALDGSVKGIPESYAAEMLAAVHKAAQIQRFDNNPVSDRVLNRFAELVQSTRNVSLATMAEIFDKSFAPEILKVLDAQKEMRAALLTTEQQRNSFMSDKAKEIGYTIKELNAVMNSAYIYIPLAGKYNTIETDETYVVKAALGIAWYKVDVNNDQVKVRFVKKILHNVVGIANKRALGLRKGAGMYRDEAHVSIATTAAENIGVSIREMKDFALSGQIVRIDGSTLGVDIGANEGIAVDDKFILYQQYEDESGTVYDEESGWGRVSEVADTAAVKDSLAVNEYISEVSVVSGSPIIGNVMREYSRLPLDLSFNWRMMNSSLTTKDDKHELLDFGNAIQLEGLINVGKSSGISQLYLVLGLGLGFPSESDTNSLVNAAIATNYDLSIMKKFMYRRVAVSLQAGGSVGGLYFSDEWQEQYDAHCFSGFGAFGLDLALTPSLTLSAKVRYDIAADVELTVEDDMMGQYDVLFNTTGMTVQAGLIWSVPSISFNIVDIIKLGLGI